jgi:hypothetical protein
MISGGGVAQVDRRYAKDRLDLRHLMPGRAW